MIIYNTTFVFEDSIREEGVRFLKKVFIPRAIATGVAKEPQLACVLEQESLEQTENYAVQFKFDSRETLCRWEQEEGSECFAELQGRYRGKFGCFSTCLEVIALDEKQ